MNSVDFSSSDIHNIEEIHAALTHGELIKNQSDEYELEGIGDYTLTKLAAITNIAIEKLGGKERLKAAQLDPQDPAAKKVREVISKIEQLNISEETPINLDDLVPFGEELMNMHMGIYREQSMRDKQAKLPEGIVEELGRRINRQERLIKRFTEEVARLTDDDPEKIEKQTELEELIEKHNSFKRLKEDCEAFEGGKTESIVGRREWLQEQMAQFRTENPKEGVFKECSYLNVKGDKKQFVLVVYHGRIRAVKIGPKDPTTAIIGSGSFLETRVAKTYYETLGGVERNETEFVTQHLTRGGEVDLAREKRLHELLLKSVGVQPERIKVGEYLISERFEGPLLEKVALQTSSEFFYQPLRSIDGKDESTQLLRKNVMYQLLQGVNNIHAAGGHHNDIKIGNILFNKSSGRVVISDLTDVGVDGQPARAASPDWHSHYDLESHFRGEGDPLKMDVFSMGKVFLILLLGEEKVRNYEKATNLEPMKKNLIGGVVITLPSNWKDAIHPKIPDELAKLIEEMIDPDASKRPNADKILKKFESISWGKEPLKT